MLWIALILPALPLQVFTRSVADPGSLAVVEYRPRQRVVAVSAGARARGVEPGTGLAGARAIAPDLELKERDPALEQRTLAEFATWAGCFTPAVSIDAPDGIVIEVSRSLRLFGGLPKLAAKLEKDAASLGFDVRLAAAPTPLGARWLAEAKPGTLTRPSSGWDRCLDSLPLHVLAADPAVSRATIDLLHGIGARSIGDVARLPRDGLARRQGTSVTHALARAHGEVPDPRPWHHPPERFDARLVLPAAADKIEPLLFASRRLVTSLVAWLTGLHAAVDRCCLCLEHEDRPATVVHIITGQPGRAEDRFLMLMREHLAVLQLDAPVEALRLSADTPVIRSACTPDLFGDPGQARDAATLLLDRLRARLGKAAVRSLRPWPDHRPEHAWRESEPGAHNLVQSRKGLPRPAWLLPEPRHLPSIDGLVMLAGPERIESGWWDGEDVRRDYFVARTRNAALWWIFRRLDRPGGWYVHGYFG
ncbi:MAG TPA: DNA polymerase Y family protein [Rhodocyclaceae bacterium]|nr:DNA polymerase Y family protein [Rhodocyclaceae bacterium]HRQ46530.1 DNA polymerase Y family protein [Rhodocyclaceae bacterium]